MRRIIFMPTDLTQASLSLIEQTLANAGNDELVIVLTLCVFQTDSISELLFYDKDEFIAALGARKFSKELGILRNRYPHAKVKFNWEVFNGLNLAAFDNFVVGNQINEAVVPDTDYMLNNTPRSFDPTPYVRKSRLKVTTYPTQFIA